jgi:hypothetical protein
MQDGTLDRILFITILVPRKELFSCHPVIS